MFCTKHVHIATLAAGMNDTGGRVALMHIPCTVAYICREFWGRMGGSITLGWVKSVKRLGQGWVSGFGSLSNCRYCSDHTQSLPWPVPNIWLTKFQISPKSVHFGRSCSRPREGRQNAPCNSRQSYSFSPSKSVLHDVFTS